MNSLNLLHLAKHIFLYIEKKNSHDIDNKIIVHQFPDMKTCQMHL